MDSAEVYMTLLRPSMVPVFGEASPLEFTGQVELASWSWNIINADEKKRADDAEKALDEKWKKDKNASGDKKNQNTALENLKEINRQNVALEDAKKQGKFKDPDDFDTARRKFSQNLKKLSEDAYTAVKKIDTTDAASGSSATGVQGATGGTGAAAAKGKTTDPDKSQNFEFSFSKRVDVATTQMLNSMKAGDIFPTAVLTIHQRSANSGLSLIITVQKLRLLEYTLKCEVSDTMTDMREDWKADFYSLAYVYKNRKAIKKASGVGQAVATAATQGTVRAFAMNNIGLPI